MLDIGQKAPEFSLKAHTGETITRDAIAGQFVVVVFYPKNDTPG